MHISARKMIMVVEDDQAVLDSFEVIFGDDYDLILTRDGHEALNHLKGYTPHLVFVDIHMPLMSGIELLEEMRKRGMDVKVVIITDYPDDYTEARARELGAISYLKKPLCANEMTRIATEV